MDAVPCCHDAMGHWGTRGTMGTMGTMWDVSVVSFLQPIKGNRPCVNPYAQSLVSTTSPWLPWALQQPSQSQPKHDLAMTGWERNVGCPRMAGNLRTLSDDILRYAIKYQNDVLYGSAGTFSLGGIFIELEIFWGTSGPTPNQTSWIWQGQKAKPKSHPERIDTE